MAAREGRADVLVDSLPTVTGRIRLTGTVSDGGVQYGAYVTEIRDVPTSITPFSFAHADPRAACREGITQTLNLPFLFGPGLDFATVSGGTFSLVLGTRAEVGFEWATADLSLRATGLFARTDLRSAD